MIATESQVLLVANRATPVGATNNLGRSDHQSLEAPTSPLFGHELLKVN